jgi:uncharacterized protein with beta-barrel porin domain
MMNLKQYLACTTLLGTALMTSAQVSVNGNNVSVNTRDGTSVNVNGGRVVVNTPNQGQTAVAVGSGRTAVNVGTGNVVSNSSGTIGSSSAIESTQKPKDPRKNPKVKQRKSEQSSDKDEAFWGKGGFWGEEGKKRGE